MFVLEEDFRIARDQILSIELGGKHPITINMKRENRTLQDQSARNEVAITANVEFEPNAKVKSFLEDIVNRKVPNSLKTNDEKWNKYIQSHGVLKENIKISIYDFPQGVRDSLSNVFHEMRDAIVKTFGNLRWYLNIKTKHSPLTGGDSSWSIDGNEWHKISTTYLRPGVPQVVPTITRVDLDKVREQIVQNINEPLPHILLREARDSERINNKRSALLLSVAAAEIAIKNVISELVPNSKWLVVNLPSPSIIKIFNDYFPKLSSVEIALQQQEIDLIEVAVSMRNTISHVGEQEIENQKLTEIIEAIQRLLWLCDYKMGNEFAKKHFESFRFDYSSEKKGNIDMVIKLDVH